jgi:nitroreductase
MNQTIDKETTKKQVLEAYMNRHATKTFDETQKIADDDFQFILETGRLSPSSFGMEPWKFVVIQDPALREKIRSVSWGAQGQLPTASHFVLLLARTAPDLRQDSEYVGHILKDIKQLPDDVQKMMLGYYQNFLENDSRFMNSDKAISEWSYKQTYIPLGNMMTAAAQIGIDSCPIEGFDHVKVSEILTEKNILEDNRFGLATMVAFGYRKEEPHPKARQSMDKVVQWV